MEAEKAVVEQLRAAVERGDVAAIDRAFADSSDTYRAGLRLDCAAAKAKLTREGDARSLRPGIVAAWFCGLKLAVRGLVWRAKAEQVAMDARLSALEARVAALEAQR